MKPIFYVDVMDTPKPQGRILLPKIDGHNGMKSLSINGFLADPTSPERNLQSIQRLRHH